MKVIRESYRAGESWPFFVTLERGEEIRGYFRVNYDALVELAYICEGLGDLYAQIQNESENDTLNALFREMAECERKTARIIREALGVENG